MNERMPLTTTDISRALLETKRMFKKLKKCEVCGKDIPKNSGFDSQNDHRNWKITDEPTGMNIRITPMKRKEGGKAELCDVCRECMRNILRKAILTDMAEAL